MSALSKKFKEKNLIRTVKELSYQDFEDIQSGKILAIRVQDFYPKSECKRAALRLVNDDKLDSYAVAPNIHRRGKAIFDAASDPQKLDEYYRVAGPALKEIRRFFHPYIAPMDKLRLELQEIWPGGSTLENLHGRLMFCGLTRLFKAGSFALPHTDQTHWDVPESRAAWSLQTQFAANVYLQPALKGGGLELWETKISSKEEYDSLCIPNSYGLDHKKIGPSSALLYPQEGELIVFDARRIHAVQTIEEGNRLSSSCFIGYRGLTQPLTIYS
jgi:hypothetical protein